MFEAINHHAAAYSSVLTRDRDDSASASLDHSEKTKAKSEEKESRDSVELSREATEIRQLKARDREVRAHEAAHAAAGGAYAGSPNYKYERGPDGARYAVAGDVSIDVSPVAGDPEATLQKARQVRAAALAPAEPSAQDLRVAQQAQALTIEAQSQLAEQKSLTSEAATRSEVDSGGEADPGEPDTLTPAEPDSVSRGPSLADSNPSKLDIRA